MQHVKIGDSAPDYFTVVITHSAKKFLGTFKSSLFTKMLHILGKLKAYYVKQMNVLFILIPNMKLINNRVLIIWMDTTGTFLKVAIQLYRASDRWADLYLYSMLMNGTICNFSKRICLHSYGQNSVINQPNLAYKFGIKMKKTST